MANAVEPFEAIPHRPEADSFDFRRSWMGIRNACNGRRWMILLTCLFTVGLMAAYIRIWPPIFVATVKLVGESNQDRYRENFYQNWAVFRGDQLTDEVHMITSAPVLSEVVGRMGLTEATVYHTFLGHVGFLWTNSRIGQAYRHYKELVFPPEPNPWTVTPEEAEKGRTVAAFKNGVRLDRVMETNVGTLSVSGPSPRVAEVANTMIEVYFQQRRARHVAEADTAYQALSTEMDKARQEITGIEDAMRRYYSENNLLLTFEKDKLDIGQAQVLKASIVELQIGIATNEQTLQQLDTELARESREVVASRVTTPNPVYETLRNRLSELQVSRQQMLMHFRPDSPDVADIERKIAIVNEQMARQPGKNLAQTTMVLSSRYEDMRGRAAQLRADLAGQRAALASRQAAYAEAQTMLSTIPEKMRAVHEMQRSHQAVEKKMAAIQEKMMVAAVSRATAQSGPPTIRVVEPAAVPAEASWPRSKLLYAAAAAVGLVFGVLLALLTDLFFGRVHRLGLAFAARDMTVYALVQRDQAFAARLFALPPLLDGGRPSLRDT